MQSTHNRLCLKGISLLSQRKEWILDDVSFTVSSGERLAVIGPNGSGKSSLLRTIICEQAHHKGEISLNGQSLESMSAQERARQIAFLSQTDIPDLRLTLEEYVTLGRLPYAGRTPYAKEQKIISEAIGNAGLQPLKHRPPSQLSGCQRQRAALARTLTQSPSLLLLDEPTNHLDPLGRSELLSLVKDLGIAVVAVLHDLQLTSAFADKVLVLCKGKQVICDTPDIALQTAITLPVFGMKSFSVSHPESGKTLKIFEVPLCA